MPRSEPHDLLGDVEDDRKQLTLGALEYRTRDLRRALGNDARPDIAEALAELERAVEAVVEAVKGRSE